MKSNPLASNNIAHTHLVSPALASTDSGASNLDLSTEASFNREQAQATLDYYNENATTFCQNTVNADMSAHYEHFLRYFLKTNNMSLSPVALTPPKKTHVLWHAVHVPRHLKKLYS